jgi:hypothetical protein
MLAALATAPIAGVPALAGHASKSNDPVFQAMAALEPLKIHAEELDAAYEIAEAAFFRAREENGVGITLDGKEMRTHKQIDAHFTPLCDEEEFSKILGRIEILRPRRLSSAERAERDIARQAAHDELARKEAAIVEVKQRIGYRTIEAQKDAAEDAVWDAEFEVMAAKPATTAGAVALLRFVTESMEVFFTDDDDDDDKYYVAAIRNAADFFERSAPA